MKANFDSRPGRFVFYCPGCLCLHSIPYEGDHERLWTWDGNTEKPTFAPSLLVNSGHYIPGHAGDCWCDYNEGSRARGEREAPFKCERCHSFIRSGQIEFLSDCTHSLAGQTVDVPVLESAI
jgi:hypothetical protein